MKPNASNQKQENLDSIKSISKTPLKESKPLATSSPMFPPTSAIQKLRIEQKISKLLNNSKSFDKMSDNSEDLKYKMPSSPSASSSSSVKISKKIAMKPRVRNLEISSPISLPDFPSSKSTSQMVEAPVFYPTEKEFQDPIEYIEKIRIKAEKFGICRIVPPATFKPECKVSDDMRFTAYNQYVNKMLHRWGPNFKELLAIRKYLSTQNITLNQPPWVSFFQYCIL